MRKGTINVIFFNLKIILNIHLILGKTKSRLHLGGMGNSKGEISAWRTLRVQESTT